MGCFAETVASRVVTQLLGSSLERLNSVDRCLANAGASGRAVVFLALQRTQCYGAAALPPALVTSQLPDAACNMACPGAAMQRCGGAVNATTATVSVYRVMQGLPPLVGSSAPPLPPPMAVGR